MFRRLSRFVRGDAGGIDATHLARADPNGRKVLRIDDGVGFDMLGDGKGKKEVGHLVLCRFSLRYHLEIAIVDLAVITALKEESARQVTEDDPRLTQIRHAAGDQYA